MLVLGTRVTVLDLWNISSSLVWGVMNVAYSHSNSYKIVRLKRVEGKGFFIFNK